MKEEEDSKKIKYYSAIEEYTDEDLNTPWMLLELFKHGHLKYIPEYAFVYWLTRYIAVLGDSRYVEWPHGLLDWLNDAGVDITDRQRVIGEQLVDEMMFFLAESHYDTVWNGRQAALEHAEELRIENDLDTITDALNLSGDDEWIHRWLLRLAEFEPWLIIAGRLFTSRSLLELKYALQQERPYGEKPDADVTIRRREIVGPFNWMAIKDHTPRCIRPDVIKFHEKLWRALQHYEKGEKYNSSTLSLTKKRDILWMDADSDLNEYTGEPGTYSSHETCDASPTSYLRSSSWERAVNQARGLRRRGNGDAQIAEKMGISLEEVSSLFFVRDTRPLWHNPDTGVVEYYDRKGWRIKQKAKRLPTPKKLPDPECVYCKAKAPQWICWRCQREDEKHFDARGNPPKNIAWGGSYPLHAINFTPPLVFARGNSIGAIRAHVEWLRANNLIASKRSDPKLVWVPEDENWETEEEDNDDDSPVIFSTSCQTRNDIVKSRLVWDGSFFKRGSWWGSIKDEEVGVVCLAGSVLYYLRPEKENVKEVIDSPEGVVSRLGPVLKDNLPEKERKRNMPLLLDVAWVVLNMYGNPYIRDIGDEEPGHFGYIPIERLLLNYTQQNVGIKLGKSSPTMTRVIDLLEEAMLALPGNTEVDTVIDRYRKRGIRLPKTPLRVAAWNTNIVQNIESITDASITTAPLTAQPDRRRWNVSGMITVLYETREERRRWALKELEIPPRLTESDTRWLEEPWPRCSCGKESIIKTADGNYYCGRGCFKH